MNKQMQNIHHCIEKKNKKSNFPLFANSMQQNKTQQNRRSKRTNNSHCAIIVWKQNVTRDIERDR